MNLLLIASAATGFASAIGHSYLSERFMLRPMFAARGDNRVLGLAPMRRVIRGLIHLPSFAWALIAMATLWFGVAAPSSDLRPLVYVGVALYYASALINLWALRRPHVGNILLTLAALGLWFGAEG